MEVAIETQYKIAAIAMPLRFFLKDCEPDIESWEAPGRVKNKIAGQTMDDWKSRPVVKSMLPHFAVVGNRQEPRKLQESVRQWAMGGGGL